MDKLEKGLSIEQEFNHRIFSDYVRQLSQQEAQELLLQMHLETLYKDNVYRDLFLSQGKDIVDALFGVEKN
ncbi:phycobilisome degradation protein NblA [Chondrocystis sp. NIES-4102]|nr:phycobilisome degradation protein NblA [Chondrocystis sp. NIES-4102]